MATEAAGAPRLLVVAAMREELAPLLERGVANPLPRIPGGRAFELRLAAEDGALRVLAAWTGDGAVAAGRGLEALLNELPVGAVLGIGVAGGLSSGLGVGTVVVARRALDERGGAPRPDEVLAACAEQSGAVPGTVFSADHIVARAADKTALGLRLREPAPLVVDLETATWGRTATSFGLPWSTLRVISDPVDDDLPLDFARFQDPQGSVRRGSVVRHVALRPGLIGPLKELQRRVAGCAERLADVTAETLRRRLASPLESGEYPAGETA